MNLRVGARFLSPRLNGLWMVAAMRLIALTHRGSLSFRGAAFQPPASSHAAWQLLHRARLDGIGALAK